MEGSHLETLNKKVSFRRCVGLLGHCDKVPKIERLTSFIIYVTVLEVRSPRPRGHHGWFLPRAIRENLPKFLPSF